MRKAAAMLVFCSTTALAGGMPLGEDEGFIAGPEGPLDEVTDADRAANWARIDAAGFRAVTPKADTHPLFRWPLRAVGGFSDPGFSLVLNHVDHDAASPDHLLDYNCGTRTYDRDDGYNHLGTDIGLWPDPWNLTLSGRIEVVAGAAGTIVSRADGNPDLSCRRNVGADWNAVHVLHDDGSSAWYGHIRTGTVTPKRVGERVAVGEYLGKVGASGNASLPHVHLEVYDVARRLVDPFAGACNKRNADTWWEQQRPYTAPLLLSVTPASDTPTSSTCGADGRLQDPGSLHGRTAFARGATVYLVVAVQDLPVGGSVHYEVRDPTNVLAFSRDNTPTATALHTSTWWASFRLPADAPVGTWMVEARLGDSRVQAPFTVTADGSPLPHYTDLWWTPAESGWGVNLVHQGEHLFATWFTYDADGSGMWLVMSDGTPQPGNAMGGTMYRTTGMPLEQIHGAPAVTMPPAVVGSATFTFTDTDHATMAYSVNGFAQSKALVRQRFSTAATCMQTRGSRASATNFQDLWWNPAESGWGINLAHQGDTIFATWFTYGAAGRGAWYVASDVRRQPTNEFRGRLYRTRGTPFDRISGAPAVTAAPEDVGDIALTFTDGENGRLDYTVGGVRQSKDITRQVFAAGTPLCR